jgi:hypothetical protein
VISKLPSVSCPECNRILESAEYIPNKAGSAQRASGYGSCLRRCEKCGIGLSNARSADISKLTRIYRDPFRTLPDWLRQDCYETLGMALNENHRQAKRTEFHSGKSEDHVTWTIFRYLQKEGGLLQALHGVGIEGCNSRDVIPTLLLWGVAIPPKDERGNLVRNRLVNVLDKIGEHPKSRSEPDVVVDFSDNGLVIIEVKHFSPNDKKSGSFVGWDRYVRNTDAFSDTDGVRKSGLYELARNWRIAWDLANGRPFELVNLGPPALFQDKDSQRLSDFRGSLNRGGGRDFLTVSWPKLFENIRGRPDWFRRYVRDRGLLRWS